MDEHVATVCEWRMVTCDHCSEPHPKCLLQVSFNDKEFAQMHGINKYTDIKIVVINMATIYIINSSFFLYNHGTHGLLAWAGLYDS